MIVFHAWQQREMVIECGKSMDLTTLIRCILLKEQSTSAKGKYENCGSG